MTNRSEPQLRATVQRIADRPQAQVLVIGGGINGIATFRDLALQGVDVVLAERADFASGASAASSHMIHGGIRYLENGEFRLVRESVQERNGLLRIAPHYVKPLETTMPIHSTFSGILSAPLRFLTHRQGTPKERGALLIEVGMTLYDSFSRNGGSLPRHRFRTRKAAFADLPRLNPSFRYTATYFDASVHDPERLALDVLLDGVAAGGSRARAANRLEAVGAEDGRVLLRDLETGTVVPFSAEVVVNASGPWTDLTNAALGDRSRFMGGTKGSHIVLDSPELLAATKGRELFFENDDGRIVLIYPLKGRVLVGTTDIDADPAEAVVCTEEEVDYFFDLVRHVFPDVPLGRDHIVYRYSGIRPLPRHDDTTPGFVSRDYRIEQGTMPGLGGTPVLSLVGGKWTTFRALAEHLADESMARLGTTRTTGTRDLAIGGGRGFPTTSEGRAHWVSTHDALGAERAEQLLERYGTRAAELIAAVAADPDDVPIAGTTFSTAEVRFLVERELVVHLADVVLRRTDLAFTGTLTRDVLETLADVTGAVLGWDGATRTAEIDAIVHELASAHQVELTEAAAAAV
jgi:glycerol-3-phosphate dehydrogenase